MRKNKMLTTEEREVYGSKLVLILKELLGTKVIGNVQKASIKIEVNEPIEIEIKTLL